MKEFEFNEIRDELIDNIQAAKDFISKIQAYDKFVNFMRTKSHNSYWNPKYKSYIVSYKNI